MKQLHILCFIFAILGQNGYTLDCNGYKECGYGQIVNATVEKYEWINCEGAFSCNSATNVITRYLTKCSAAASCANVPDISGQTAYKYVDCEGTESCADSSITIHDLECSGVLSCYHANITAHDIDGYGEYSLANSTITMVDFSTIKLFGHLAGLGSNIECPISRRCSIECLGTGCVGATLTGYGTWTGASLTGDGTWTVNYNTPSSNQWSRTIQTAIIKDQSCSLTFDNQFTAPDSISYTGEDSVCCRGSASCYSIDSITTAHTLICSGQQSCLGVGVIRATDIICSGVSSCRDVVPIESTGNIYCDSYFSCWLSSLIVNGNAYCGGYKSCYQASISIMNNGSSTIIFSGYQSGREANVYCSSQSECHIKCVGGEACTSTILQCDGQCDVQCNVDTGCPDSLNPTNAPTPTAPTPAPRISLGIKVGEISTDAVQSDDYYLSIVWGNIITSCTIQPNTANTWYDCIGTESNCMVSTDYKIAIYTLGSDGLFFTELRVQELLNTTNYYTHFNKFCSSTLDFSPWAINDNPVAASTGTMCSEYTTQNQWNGVCIDDADCSNYNIYVTEFDLSSFNRGQNTGETLVVHSGYRPSTAASMTLSCPSPPSSITSSYILNENNLTFYDSEASCLFKYSTHLASIHNNIQNTEAINTSSAAASNVWIGLADDINEGNFYWTDDTEWEYGTNISGGIYPWYLSQPDNFNNSQHCTEIDSIHWNDIHCSNKQYSLCNYPQNNYIINDPSNIVRIP
eukprot:334367_1